MRHPVFIFFSSSSTLLLLQNQTNVLAPPTRLALTKVQPLDSRQTQTLVFLPTTLHHKWIYSQLNRRHSCCCFWRWWFVQFTPNPLQTERTTRQHLMDTYLASAFTKFPLVATLGEMKNGSTLVTLKDGKSTILIPKCVSEYGHPTHVARGQEEVFGDGVGGTLCRQTTMAGYNTLRSTRQKL